MSDSHTATDVITYIGVPLAVLGVLPILYNTVATLAALSRIKRMLRQQSGLSHGSYLTRSDVVNRVIEVDLPRYAVRPWDRFTDGERYWRLSRKVSSIRGGSWTRFNWRVRVVGMERQRVEYADQLRQPQVEILFEELICYLLDLGAVPDPHGWRVLRSTGLWTPVGCALMMSPDGREKALTIAPPDGSDGHLSLAVAWREEWTVRGAGDLPPYWVRLMPAGEGVRFELKEVGQGEAQGQVEESTQVEGEGSASKEVRGEVGPEGESEQKGKKTAEDTTPPEVTSAQKSSLDSTATRSSLYSSHPITCQISAEGIVTALSDANPPSPSPRADHLSPFNDAPPPYSSSSSLHNPTNTLYIEHLRIRPSSILTSPPSGVPPSTGTWFASLATAYGTSSQTILWHYKIPDSILLFARRETVPCGVLVLLDIVDESTTPEWLSQSAKQAEEEDKARRLELLAARAREQRVAMEREMRCKDPVERGKMVRERMLREGEERLRDVKERIRLEAQRKEIRIHDALLQSPKWDPRLVAEHCLAWLEAKRLVPSALFDPAPSSSSSSSRQPSSEIKDIVGMLLHRMVLDGQFAGTICRMLDVWKAWAENGGMRRSDLETLEKDPVTFAFAALMVAVLKDSSTALEGTLAMDLQECLRMWKVVRLG